jgi:phage terminase large subunit
VASDLYRRLAKKLSLTPTALVPKAFACLFEPFRYLLLFGGRGGAKSWSIARALLVQGQDAKLRILIVREIMGSIQASAWQLLKDQIELLGLGDHYTVQSDRIVGRNGTEIFFEGLFGNSQKLKSYEAIDIVWIEEAQSVSDESWEVVRPTMRKPGSRIIVSWNPLTRHDAVMRFVTNPMPRSIIKKVGWEDNEHLSAEAHEEREWLQKVDPDAYRHVWLGEPREVSDALILKGKYVVEPVTVSPDWSGPYYGLDLGFGADPCAATECYIDDATRTLYVKREYWGLHVDIDALPGQLELAIPGIGQQVVHADSSRPETISYLQRHGIPLARPSEKWSGSVDDGLLYLRAFSRIVLDPSCKHTLEECQTYSWRVDPKTNLPIPKPLDAHNHTIDSLRYGLGPLIRNQAPGGYFARAALLVNGEPVEPPRSGEAAPKRVFATVATSDQPGTAVGVVYFAHSPRWGLPLTVLDYDLFEVDALRPERVAALLARGRELVDEWRALDDVFRVWAEQGELYQVLEAGFLEHLQDDPILHAGGRPPYDLVRAESKRLVGSDGRQPLVTLAERANDMRTVVNQGQTVKIARGAYDRQVTHRSSPTNHLVSQLLGYRPDRETAQELVAAFALGVLSAREPGAPAPAPAEPLPVVVEPQSEQPAGAPGPWGPRRWTGFRVL